MFVLGEGVKQILLCNVIHIRHLTIVELSSNKRIEYQMNDLKRERRPRTFSTIFVTIYETSTPFSVDKIYTVEFTQPNSPQPVQNTMTLYIVVNTATSLLSSNLFAILFSHEMFVIKVFSELVKKLLLKFHEFDNNDTVLSDRRITSNVT